ncbi:hypothetical protein L3X38_007705 [Prunus dulcis]|uniref:Retrotransposon Copia-like N-terminal domain-containing protein n=1 Tax=Prunus dulcis TaxID=3755 RepID=A0AAD4ZV57_PRUDU|nr:hypothetical protein L3X38_007705 [Prunus dulcis]
MTTKHVDGINIFHDGPSARALPKLYILTLLLQDTCHAHNPLLQSHIGNMSIVHASQGLYKKTPILKRKEEKPTLSSAVFIYLLLSWVTPTTQPTPTPPRPTPLRLTPQLHQSVPLTTSSLKLLQISIWVQLLYVVWSRSVHLAITARRMAGFINGKNIVPAINDSSYDAWEEDNFLVQSWLLNSMTKNVRVLFDHCPTDCVVWKATRKTYAVTQNSSKLYQLRH